MVGVLEADHLRLGRRLVAAVLDGEVAAEEALVLEVLGGNHLGGGR